MPEIWQVIAGLGVGGAETTLHALARALPQEGFSVRVFSLGGDGPIGDRLRADGVPLEILGRGKRDTPLAWLRLLQRLRQQPPFLMQTWLYHADFLGGWAARLNGTPVVWGVHHVLGAEDALKPGTRAVMRANAGLSRWLPAAVVCCSAEALASHRAAGYAPQRLHLIENGVDTERFAPRPAKRAQVRRALGLPSTAVVLGHGGRLHPLKAQDVLLQAFTRAFPGRDEVHLLLWGRGLEAENPLWAAWAADPRIHFLGLREDVPDLLQAVDGFVLSSRWEAFPVTLLEAMACAVPCLSTAAGAAAEIIGETGLVTPVDDVEALAAALRQLADMPAAARQALGRAARQRIVERYSLSRMAARYAALYRSLR